jgi:hypothetical protein
VVGVDTRKSDDRTVTAAVTEARTRALASVARDALETAGDAIAAAWPSAELRYAPISTVVRAAMLRGVPQRDDPFADAAEQLAARIAAHDELRAGKRYTDARLHLARLVQDFATALRVSSLAFTRYPHSVNWLLQNSIDDLLESAIALPALLDVGAVNVARRELRYMVEASVKYVFVDQRLPSEALLDERLRYLGDNSKVPRSSVTPIDELKLWMLEDDRVFRGAVKQSFGALSGYVHPSERALDERFARAERGESSGFEGPGVVEAFNRLASQTLDVVLVLVFQGIGPTFTGDVFIQLLDDRADWKFHRTRFSSEVARSFEYKVERRSPR